MNKLLTEEFLSNYTDNVDSMTNFGHFVYLRTYSRWLEEEGRRETWKETVTRAVEHNCSLVPGTTKEEAEQLFDNIYNLRQFLSGRSMYSGGTEVSRLYPTSNFNCAFTKIDNFKAFEDIFYLSMVGAGVGFRVLKEDVEKLPKVRTDITLIQEPYKSVEKSKRQEFTTINQVTKDCLQIVVGDSKESWTQALEIFLSIFHSNRFRKVKFIMINYDNVRPIGEKLSTFGGTASGHTSIEKMFQKMHKILTNGEEVYKKLRTIDAMDMANIIAENVVSGGVRRSAQICLFGSDDEDILSAKTNLYVQDEDGNWSINKEISHRQMSNNSIYYLEKPSMEQIKWQIEQQRFSGEPGFINGAAMSTRRDNANGVNPCGEILLDANGLCNLTTVNVMSFVKDGKLDFEGLMNAQKLSARAGYRMANIELELPNWDAVQQRDKLIGCSFTGWQDMINEVGFDKEEEIDVLQQMRNSVHSAVEEYANNIGENAPLLSTTIKPEGTLSCLPTVSSGIHYSHSPYFVRRVRVSAHDPLVKVCEELGYPVFAEVGQDWETCTTKVVEFPVESPKGRTKYDVSALEQLENYRMTMKYYTDHNTSITVSCRDHEWDAVVEWLHENWDDVIGISFLALDDSFYQLLPYESISEEEYNERVKNMKEFDQKILEKFETSLNADDDVTDADCASGACPVR
ncbi:MAG: ribonucleoside-triphosphate reductase, adenosylcobalamin-dependent [Bacilli bacterium]|uniref:ribonucleoside-triphosphate reductase, adenosylcobalamin-dependent n=1 Tax=Clostridium sp. TaxID=1506 RepID=UPI002FC84129